MISDEAALAIFVFALVALSAMSLSLGLVGGRQPSTGLRMPGRRSGRGRWARDMWRDLSDRYAQRVQSEKPAVRHLQETLVNAGFERVRGLVVFRAVQLLAALVGAAAGLALSSSLGGNWFACLLAGASLGFLLPYSVLKRLRRRRQLEIMRELPAVLDLLVVSLEAGLSIGDAIKTVGMHVQHQGHVLGQELSTAASEMVAGLRLEDCLRNLGERTGVEDIRSVAALLIQSEKIGASLGLALRASAAQMVTNRRLKAEEAAQKSAIKMLVPLVLFTLPSMIIIILGPAIIQITRVLAG